MAAPQKGRGPGKKDGSKPQNRRRQGGGRQNAPAHPGFVLATVLEDTPLSAAAKWFDISAGELTAVLEGRASMTPGMCTRAGEIFGTGAAPWLDLQSAWDAHLEALAQKAAARVKAAQEKEV